MVRTRREWRTAGGGGVKEILYLLLLLMNDSDNDNDNDKVMCCVYT